MSYEEGLRLFREGQWFEAHEVLEHHWRATPPGPEKLFYQGLIQLAVSLEHWKRGNPRGALGQWQKGVAKMEGLSPVYGGIALAELLADFEVFYREEGLEEAVQAQAEGRPLVKRGGRAPVPRLLF